MLRTMSPGTPSPSNRPVNAVRGDSPEGPTISDRIASTTIAAISPMIRGVLLGSACIHVSAAFLQASGLRWNGDAGQGAGMRANKAHSSCGPSLGHLRCRELGLLPPPLAGEGWGRGSRKRQRMYSSSLSLPRKRGSGRWGTRLRRAISAAAGTLALFTAVGGLVLSLPSHAADPPRRVVSFNVCADQLLVALAEPGQIAALSPHATNEVLSTVAEQARAYPRTGWTAESVVPFAPDLVLLGYSWDRSPTMQMMRALGLRLAPIGLVNDIDGALAQIHEVAALLGHPERAAVLLDEIAAARSRLAEARRSMSSTALLIAQGGYTVGPTSLAAALMAEAGLRPPAGAPSGYGGFVPLEQLITLRPDYLVMASAIETPDSQGALYLTHPALRALYPPERRIILPTRYTLCGGASLVAAFDYLTGVVQGLAPSR